jgi:phenylacetate-CoA ligase
MAGPTLSDRPFWNADAEAADPAVLRRREARLLRSQLAATAATSPFYRAKWAEAKAQPDRVRHIQDLPTLPFTEKAELQAALAAQPPFGTNQAAPADALVRMQATGGTTGTPLRMAMTRADVAVYSEVGARAAWAAGLRPGDILFECMNYSLYAGGVNDHGTFETLGACVAAIGVGQSRRLLEIVSDLGAPSVLYSTPSYALHLASVARDVGLEPREIGIRRGLFSGDAGLENAAYRAEIEATWGMVARSIYGTSETAPVAAECDAADGLHWLGQEAFVAEFVDPESGDPVAIEDGATAELVITTIRREAHPLIRFRTHDFVRLSVSPCSCGRSGLRFHVLGRSDDMFIVRGINVFPLAVAALVDEFRPWLSGEFRIVLDEPPPLVAPPRVRVEAAPDTSSERFTELAAALATRIRTTLTFSPLVEVVAAGSYPRGELKTRRLVRGWLGES